MSKRGRNEMEAPLRVSSRVAARPKKNPFNNRTTNNLVDEFLDPNTNRNNKLRIKSYLEAKGIPIPSARKKRAKSALNKKLLKEYYLLFKAISNTNLSNSEMDRLISSAKAFRLSRPAQLQSWAGSFLETAGFNAGARARKTAVVDLKTLDTDPVTLVSVSTPTLFIKSAFNIQHWLKNKMGNVPTGNILNKNMRELLKHTEIVAAFSKNEGNNNSNVTGKVKGTSEIQPDIILSLPTSKELHIYELKIGLGKPETIPAESLQLAKIKYLIELNLKQRGITGWKVKIHFLPWIFGTVPNTVLDFKNWAQSPPKSIYKKWADNFIRRNSNYNINISKKNNSPLKNYLNINTVNNTLGISRVSRTHRGGMGAVKVAAKSSEVIIANINRRGPNAVKNFLSKMREVSATGLNKSGTFSTVSRLGRQLHYNMIKAAQRYYSKLPTSRVPSSLISVLGRNKGGVFHAQGGNVNSESNNNMGRNTQINHDRLQALTKAIASYEAFIKGANGINNPSQRQLADLAAIKSSIAPMSKSNAILARVNANKVSASFDPFRTVTNLLGQYNKQSVLNALAGKQGPEYNAIKTVLMRRS
jgi:hypothetical protein